MEEPLPLSTLPAHLTYSQQAHPTQVFCPGMRMADFTGFHFIVLTIQYTGQYNIDLVSPSPIHQVHYWLQDL